VWYEDARAWPFKPAYGEISINEMSHVDSGSGLDQLSGGALRIGLRNGKSRRVSMYGGDLNEWIVAIRRLIASKRGESGEPADRKG
jgi:hypothetical protein